jgi:hypothetical protein
MSTKKNKQKGGAPISASSARSLFAREDNGQQEGEEARVAAALPQNLQGQDREAGQEISAEQRKQSGISGAQDDPSSVVTNTTTNPVEGGTAKTSVEGGSIRWQSQLPPAPSNGTKGQSNLLTSIFQRSSKTGATASQPSSSELSQPVKGQAETAGENRRRDVITESEQEYVRMSAAELKAFSDWKASQGAAITTFKEVHPSTFSSPPAPAAVAQAQAPAAVVILVGSSDEEEDSAPVKTTPQRSPQKKSTSLEKGGGVKHTDNVKTTGKDTDGPRLAGKVCVKPKNESPQKSTPKKRILQEVRCPRCGCTDPQHDWLRCKEPRLDFPRSADENAFLKQVTILQRMSSAAKMTQRKEYTEDSSEEGEDLGGDEEDEKDMLADEQEEEDEEAVEEDDDSAEPGSSSSSDPTYLPSSESNTSVSRPGKASKQEARLERMESAITQLTTLLMASARPTMAPISSPFRRDEVAPSAVGMTEGKSVLSHTPGMEGCPELQREDLLNFTKFEELEKKYKEYLDKAADRRRTSHNIVYGFRKFSFELRQYIRTLFNKNHTLRETYRSVLPSFDLSEEDFLALPNAVFQKLYREVCTHHSCLPSQVLQSLETIRFQRGSQGDHATLPSLVVQASAAFRERLRQLPRQTISQCTNKQLKESFIRMLLGPDERNLADFPRAETWEEVISALLDLDGTSEANTLVHKIRQVGKSEGKPHKEEEAPREDRGGGARQRQKPASSSEVNDDDASWKPQLEKLMTEFKPTPQQLHGCSTNHQKVLRILQIRDTRKREQELKDMRASSTDSSVQVPAAPQTTLTKPQPQSRSQLSDDGPTCYYCKEKGHYKRDCPKRDKSGESSDADDQ